MDKLDYYLKKILEFRIATCLPVGSGANADNRLHEELFTSEYFEFIDHKGELWRQADGLVDQLVIYGGWLLDGTPPVPYETFREHAEATASAIGINLLESFDLVHDSLMSKVCKGSEIAATEAKYHELGVEIEWRESSDDLFAAFAANTTPHAPKGKLLKCASYHEPNWAGTTKWKHPSTKRCPRCGGTQLFEFGSMFMKLCEPCNIEIHWPLDPGQAPLIANNRITHTDDN